MKNLIEKIEKIIISLKKQYQNCFEEIDCPLFTSDEIKGKISAYQDCLNLLNQYNIITAPKSIKLSEIVSRLINATENKFTIERVQHFIVILFVDEPILRIDIPENKIGEILADCFDDTLNKWLYTLWIAGTIIEDDLECDE